jgi:hypothetical protein
MGLEWLLNVQGNLVMLMASLSELVTQADVECTAVKDYLAEKYADDFEPIKTTLESLRLRVLKAEVESEIERKYRSEKHLSLLLEERYRIYKAKLQSGERILDTLQNHIIRLRREYERTKYAEQTLRDGGTPRG